MCSKAADTYPSAIEYVSDQFKTQEMCDKAVGQYKTQKIRDKIISHGLFKLKCCHDRCKTQKLCKLS